MAEVALLLGVLLTALNTVVAGRTLWKEWKQRKEKPHPLDASLRDISLAIRERHHRLDESQAQLRQAQARLAERPARVQFE